jgi:hypothetical protein
VTRAPLSAAQVAEMYRNQAVVANNTGAGGAASASWRYDD